MIQFFRQIRKKLLIDSKIIDYLFYTSGEILLVVVGILLALHFNNVNVESDNRIKENWYLNNIYEEIRYQTDKLEYLKFYFNKSIKIAKSIIQDPYLSTDIIGVYLFCEKCEISMKTIVKICSIRIFSLFLITHIK